MLNHNIQIFKYSIWWMILMTHKLWLNTGRRSPWVVTIHDELSQSWHFYIYHIYNLFLCTYSIIALQNTCFLFLEAFLQLSLPFFFYLYVINIEVTTLRMINTSNPPCPPTYPTPALHGFSTPWREDWARTRHPWSDLVPLRWNL